MDESSLEISKEMIETKEENVAAPSSENNFLLEKYICDSASTEKVTDPNNMADEESEELKRKKNFKNQPSKKQKDDTELNLKVELMQVSASEENPVKNISKEDLSEDCGVPDSNKQNNQFEDSEIANFNPYIFESMSSENNVFTSETIYFSKGILCFEKASSSARSKPLVCKTIFVNGLPEKITEEIIKEIFQRCGSIEAIRMIGSESCFVTFTDEISAEYAMRFSGYRLKIDKKNEAPYSSILFIDYAEAEIDNSYLIQSPTASNSQIPLHSDMHFSEHETRILYEKLKNKSKFHEALCNLIGLFQQKECLKFDTHYLFPIMEKIYCHVLFLVNQKEKHEQDANISKSDLVEHMKRICQQLVHIENAFELSQKENIWSHFTKKQRKKVKAYEDHCKEYKCEFMEEIAAYEKSLNEQNNQGKENIVCCNAKDVAICNLEDEEQKNLEISFNPMISLLPHYTDNAASLICEKLASEETFTEATNTILMWLEQEECTGENATFFYSMLQCIHNHVKKLQENINENEENLQDAKKSLIKHFKEILCNLTQVERIYLAISMDHFSSKEKEHIELWEQYSKKMKLDIKQKLCELKNKIKADSNNETAKTLSDSLQKLIDEERNLRNQLEEYNNTIATMKSNFKRDSENLDRQMDDINKDIRKSKRKASKLKAESDENEIELTELRSSVYGHALAAHAVLSQDEARIISLVTIFLNIRPGSSLDSILSYLQGIDSTIDCRTVINLMRSFPSMFREEVTVIGDNIQRKWYIISIS